MNSLAKKYMSVDNEALKRQSIQARRENRDRKIRALYRQGLSMNEICRALNHSKVTVFLAINPKGSGGRRSKHKRKINK